MHPSTFVKIAATQAKKNMTLIVDSNKFTGLDTKYFHGVIFPAKVSLVEQNDLLK